jgi:protein TonB
LFWLMNGSPVGRQVTAETPVIKSEKKISLSADSVRNAERLPVEQDAVKSPEVKPGAQKQTPESKESTALPAETAKADVGYVEAAPAKGYPDLYAYFEKELTYPEEAMSNPVEGVVTVAFTITRKGKIENINIDNSLGELFDREAMRVITQMPDWKPASYNGKPVSSTVSLPLTFQYKKMN